MKTINGIIDYISIQKYQLTQTTLGKRNQGLGYSKYLDQRPGRKHIVTED